MTLHEQLIDSLTKISQVSQALGAWWCRYVQVARVRQFLLSWVVATGLILGLAPSAFSAVDTVDIRAVIDTAFESFPDDRFGVLEIERSGEVGTRTVVVGVLPDPAGFTPAYRPELDPDSGPGVTLTAVPAPTFTVTMPAGTRIVRVRIKPVVEQVGGAPVARVDQRLTFQLQNGVDIVLGSSQIATIQIIDDVVVLDNVKINSVVRETTADFISGVAQRQHFGQGQLRFANPTAVFLDRFVEAQIGGSAILQSPTVPVGDYIITYRIGTGFVVNTIGRIAEPSVPLFLNAYRRSTEYGPNSVGYPFFGQEPAQTTRNFAYTNGPFNGNAILAGNVMPGGALRNRTDSFVTTKWPSPPENGRLLQLEVNGDVVPGANVLDSELRDGRTLVSLRGGSTVSLPIAQGAKVRLTFRVTPAVGLPTDTQVVVLVNETVLYPAGATSISINQRNVVQLNPGDLFILNEDVYRITQRFPTPAETDIDGEGLVSFSISPGLQKDLLRTDSLRLTTHFQSTFDGPTQNRFTWFFPGLPSGDLPGFRPARSVALPTNSRLGDTGDRVDMLFTPVDDNLVEGEESIILTALSSGATNNYIVGTPQIATYNMADNDVAVAIKAVANPQIPNVNGQVRFDLVRTPQFNMDIEYQIEFRTGDAQFGVHYDIAGARADRTGLVRGKLNVSAGQSVAYLQIIPLGSTPIASPLPIRISLLRTFSYELAGSVNGNASSREETLLVVNRSTTPPSPDPTPVTPNTGSSVEQNDGSGGCGTGSGIAIICLCSLLLFVRFRSRSHSCIS